ncbi:hypothetical protein C900_04783 [Fulvivirga imtechensis AK7]|uniref:Uncharacterized protein n=1 Tax=Fulvivirga imtechensis AK7 TaxID=1237149 RepID=L8K1F7_9BACT|nr:hypothetical protein [Fulvivirga imtechensis]ELR73272.1 hypothetical protein C900_04783 [Fulvivirga imtechensis AK7]
MNIAKELNYKQVILLGMVTELMLVFIQFIYLKLNSNTDASLAFTTEYMRYTGFYVFQIIGFFVYTIAVFVLLKKFHVTSFYKILFFIVAGGVVELSFYLLTLANY